MAILGMHARTPSPLTGMLWGIQTPRTRRQGRGGGVRVLPQVVPRPVAAEPAPQNPVGPIVDGDDATSSDASSSDVSSLTSAVVDSDNSDGVQYVTIID